MRAPINSVREEQAPKDLGEVRRGPSNNRPSGSKAFSEKGMVRCTLNVGKSQGVQPADVVGTIAFHASIPGDAIGKITIQDRVTLVDLPQQYVAQALAKTGKYKIRKSPVTLALA
jgi:ATP-dependent RNA helicase DeaD